MTRCKHSLMQAGPQPKATTPEIASYLDLISRHDCNGDARSYVSSSRTRVAVAVGNCDLRLYEEFSEGQLRREAGNADRSFLPLPWLYRHQTKRPQEGPIRFFFLLMLLHRKYRPSFPRILCMYWSTDTRLCTYKTSCSVCLSTPIGSCPFDFPF